MKLIMKIAAICAVLVLSACATSEISEPVPFFGGSENGGFDAQTGCGAVLNGAGCLVATKTASGRIDLQQVVLKDSVQGRVVETAVTVGMSKGLDWAIARDLQDNAPACDDCGKNQVTQVQVTTNSASDARANTSAPACTTCGKKKAKLE